MLVGDIRFWILGFLFPYTNCRFNYANKIMETVSTGVSI